jgi:hypothetical protein
LALISIFPDQVACSSAESVLSCNLGEITVDDSTSITITFEALNEGSPITIVTASASETDSDNSNNSDNIQLDIIDSTSPTTRNISENNGSGPLNFLFIVSLLGYAIVRKLY